MSTAEVLIAVRGIGKRFGARQVVADLSLRASAGEIVGLVGANGGGKTTTLRMLMGLLKPDCGEGVVLGCDLQRGPRQIRERTGYMPQGASLYPSLTARENVRFRAAAFSVPRPAQAADRLLRAYGLQQFADTRVDRLSGGWARLVQLAGALIHNPRLLLLDEPTAGLDVAHRHQVWARITELARGGIGIVLSTHDLAEAERCARLVLLSEGVQLAAGSSECIIAGADVAVLAVAGEGAAGLADALSVRPGVLACTVQGNVLRVVMDSAVQPRVMAGLDLSRHPYRMIAPGLEDATLALLQRRGAVT